MSTVLLDYRDDTPYKVTQSMWDGTNSEWKLGCVDILTRQILFAYHKSFHKVITLHHVKTEGRWFPTLKVVWVRPRYDWMSGDMPHGTIGELIEKGGLKTITSHRLMDRYFAYEGHATVSETFTVLDQLVREPYIQELLDPALRMGDRTRPDKKYQHNFVYSWLFQTLGDLLGIDEEGHYRNGGKHLPREVKDAVFYCVPRDMLKAPIAEIWNMGPDALLETLNTLVYNTERSVKLNEKFVQYLTKWFNYHAAKCWIAQWEFINQMDWGSYTARAKHEHRHRTSLTFDLPDWGSVGTPCIKRPTLNTGFFALTRIFGGHEKVKWGQGCEYFVIVAKCQNEYRYDLLLYQCETAETAKRERYKPLAALRGQTGTPFIEGVYHFTFEPSDEFKSMFSGEGTQIIDDRIIERTLLVYCLAPYGEAAKLNVIHTDRDGWIPAGDVHYECEWAVTEKKILRRSAELIKGHKMKHIASNYDVPVYEWAVTAPDNCDLMFVHKAFKLTSDPMTRRIYMLALRMFLASTDLIHSKDGQVSSKKMYMRKPTLKEQELLHQFDLDTVGMKIANLSIADVWILCDIAKEVDINMIMTTYQGDYMRMLTKFLETGFAKGLDELIPKGYKPSNIGALIQLGAKAFITEFDPRYKMHKYKEGWFRSHLAVQKRKFGWYHYNGVNGMVQDY